MKKCVREGCPGVVYNPTHPDAKHCSGICRYVDRQLDLAERKNADPELWAALVELADALSNYRREVDKSYRKRNP